MAAVHKIASDQLIFPDLTGQAKTRITSLALSRHLVVNNNDD